MNIKDINSVTPILSDEHIDQLAIEPAVIDPAQLDLPLEDTAEASDPVVDGIPMTEWFPPEVKPEHIGVYKTKIMRPAGHGDNHVEVGYSHWNGTAWGPQFDTAKEAEAAVGSATFPIEYHWRGLAAEHDEHKL